MNLYLIWIDTRSANDWSGSYQDWNMYETCRGYGVFSLYLKYQFTLGVL